MNLIDELKRNRSFYGDCPSCNEEFPLHRAVLFHVKGPFPKAAIEKMAKLKAELAGRRLELKKAKHNMTTKTVTTTKSVNLGKIVEKIAPSFRSFSLSPGDCRALFEPIDYVVFSGLAAKGKVESVEFIDVKSGKANLSQSQKAVEKAIKAGKVKFQYCAGKGGR